MQDKADLRKAMRARRADFVAALPGNARALILNRPPSEIVDFVKEHPSIGFYHAVGAEAPSLGWIRWFHENGRTIALPHFTDRGAAMDFRVWRNPWDDDELESGPFGIPQPRADAPVADPSVLVVPLVAFTPHCDRLGQGAGHYDRWLAAHRLVDTIGLAWDVQRVDSLPLEPHDRALTAVVTPTRIYWKDA